MKKLTDKSKIVIVFVLILGIAVVRDFSSENLKNGVIDRGELGGEEKELKLRLDVEKLLEDYTYILKVDPMKPTQETAEKYFDETIAIIDKEFENITDVVPVKKRYVDEIVKANWSFYPAGIIDSEGKVDLAQLEKEETIIQAQAELTCGTYERIYAFSFVLKKPKMSKEQLLLHEIQEWIAVQMAEEGNAVIELPMEINGNRLFWSERKEYLTPQILLIEVLMVLSLRIFSKRKQKEEEKKRLQDMERDYADIVSQLSLLLGAGMTAKQAWNRLAVQYAFKRKQNMVSERMVYEAILCMSGRFAEGVSERVAYQQFREEISAPCYHRLIRILLGNLEKGTQEVCNRLEEESRMAFEQKIMLAKKVGEEASTKMLGPLMFMLIIIMGIIMFPALMEFKI